MTMRRGSSVSRLARLILSVRGQRVLNLKEVRSILFPNAGTAGIIEKIRETVGDRPVYLSIDVRFCSPDLGAEHADSAFILRGLQIDSIDPAFAPATGTPETGGWSTRELRTILRGLDGLHIVSADIVEVAPAYDTNAELTTMAAADVSVSKANVNHACNLMIVGNRSFLR